MPSAEQICAEELEKVRQSYSRCCLTDGFATDGFFETFYYVFINSSDDIPSFFKDTDMIKQRLLLRDGITIALMFAGEQHQMAKAAIDHLGKTHSRDQYNIDPKFYDNWMDSLLKALETHDDEYTPELATLWRKAIAPSIFSMKSAY